MNRKNKIIVSVVGITIVLLALLGLTYAYYLTRIQGNTNTNSISVTTADLRLVYRDGSANIEEVNIEPSDTIYEKIFTVTNEGNVNIDYGVYLIDVINTFVRKDDIKYKMTCTTDGTLPCNQITSDTTFPSGISELSTATIEPTKTHTYTFTFTYKDTGTDQSIDMGKELSAKIQIYAGNNNGLIIPFDSETLAYNIVNNANNTSESDSKTLGNAMYSETLNTIPGRQVSSENESLLLTAEDDYGTSYYYRGNVKNNYVNYSGMCWRIIRIQGDGKIKLVLYDENNECLEEPIENPSTWINYAKSYAYNNNITSSTNASLWKNAFIYEDSNVPSLLEEWIIKNSFDKSNLAVTAFCNDMSSVQNNNTIDYGALNRLYPNETASPSLKCREEDKVYTDIALLTADEIAYAGSVDNKTDNSYLSNTTLPMLNSNNEPSITSILYFTMSPAYQYISNWYDGGPQLYQINADSNNSHFFVGYQMSVGTEYGSRAIRPVIVLKNNITISDGVGTIGDPYIIG